MIKFVEQQIVLARNQQVCPASFSNYGAMGTELLKKSIFIKQLLSATCDMNG